MWPPLFIKTLREKVVINEHGKRKTVTKLEAALKQLANKAASGDLRAIRQLVELAKTPKPSRALRGVKSQLFRELDQEVMDGILKRFLNTNGDQREQQEIREDNNGDK